MFRYINISLLALLFFMTNAIANPEDQIAEEVAIQESPVAFYDRMIHSISFPIAFENHEQFNTIANELSYAPDVLQHKLFVLARLSMNHLVRRKYKTANTKDLIQQLNIIANNTYDLATVAMLNGRYVGKIENNYEKAISHYNQALGQIQAEHELKALILKHTIHRHLGMLYMLTRQRAPALKHFTTYRDYAYQLRDNYLITAAEAELGKYYNKTGQLALALQHFSEAFRLASLTQYPKQKAHLQLRLAQVYRDLAQWPEAMEYGQMAADSFRTLESETYVSKSMTVLAMVHAEQGLWRQAIDYYLNAQQIDAKLGNVIAQGLNFHNLGESHSKIGDIPTALQYLLKANKIFKERNVKHYLVSNELLIAEVAKLEQNWDLVKQHAQLALDIALEKSLAEEQVQALQFKADAYTALQEHQNAIEPLTQIVTILSQQGKQPQAPSNYSPSILAEQKLKLDLNVMKGKLNKAKEQQDLKSAAVAVLLIIGIILAMVTFQLYQRAREASQNLDKSKATQQLEPGTGHPGYLAFLTALDNPQGISATALFQLDSLLDLDICEGQSASNEKNSQIAQSIESELSAKCFVIRPGLFALNLYGESPTEKLLEKLQAVLIAQQVQTPVALGLLKLPIFTNLDIKVEPELHLEALQLALAGASSLHQNKADKTQSYYVSFRTLDFAPSAVFSRPLYIHLEQAIIRGLIRVDTNGNKTSIVWQKNHKKIKHNFEIN